MMSNDNRSSHNLRSEELKIIKKWYSIVQYIEPILQLVLRYVMLF